jgi:hypothetical protein
MSCTWNPVDKNANITLSNGNLTATAGYSAWQAVRSTDYKSSGKLYWEVTVAVANSASYMVGIATADASLANYIGSDAHGYSYYGSTGVKMYNGGSSAYGDTYTLNDIIGTALDLDNGKIWWSKNGVWQNSGDPAAGTNEAYSGITGDFYPAISLTNSNALTVNFGATSFAYSAPTGFASFSFTGYFTGYVYEVNTSNPVSRAVRCYRRDTGVLESSTTSSGDGYYYLETTHSGSHYLVCLDDEAGTQYNLAALDWMIPTTTS